MLKHKHLVDLTKLRMPAFDSVNGVNELYGLYDLIQDHFDKSTFLCELGTGLGVSTRLFAETCGKVVTVDMCRSIQLKMILAECPNLEFVESLTENTAALYEDGTFDAVYHDANHSYNAVKRDIELWLPKIKSGGVICGHDYITDEMAATPNNYFDWNSPEMGFGGVRKAVDELFSNVKFYKDSSWAVRCG